MGSPDFALPTLQSLIKSDHEIVACFTRAPAEKNRGKKVFPTPIQLEAQQHNIPVFTPKTLRSEEIQNSIKELKPDFLVVVAYGLILPKEVLAIPSKTSLNLHPSALPRFRGAAPLHRAIIAGDEETEICIMKMSEGLDEGDVFLKQKFKIPKNFTTGDLHDEAAKIGADLMLETIDRFDSLIPTPQAELDVVYAPKISKSEALLNFNKNGEEIINLIRGLNPFPGAYLNFENKRIKILSATFEELSHSEMPGKISNNFEIYCKNGKISPKILQREGKAKTTIKDFLNARK